MKAVFLWGPARCMHGRCRIRDANRAAPPHADARRRPQGTSGQPFQRDIGQLDRAVNDLRRRAPDLSAATPLRPWQQLTLLAVPALLTAGLILLDGPGLFLWSLVLALPFFMITLVRLAAVWHALRRPLRRSEPMSTDRRYDSRLPIAKAASYRPSSRQWHASTIRSIGSKSCS